MSSAFRHPRPRLAGVRPAFVLVAAAAAIGAVAGCDTRPRGTPPLTILAAASLAAPFQELADSLRARAPGLEVRLSFAGSHQLALQVEQGGRADLIAVADPAWLERLSAGGLVVGEIRELAVNRLVLVVPTSNPGRIGDLADLARPGIKLVLGTAEVPIGRYAREVIERLGRAPDAPPGLARQVLANVVSEEQDAGAIAAKVRLGEADAALVYRTDAGAGLRAIEIPDSMNVRARYAAAVLADAPNAAAAREFLELLGSPGGRAVLRRQGFEAPESTP